MASSMISIPVTPLILSLYNECKENLKYENKTNTDFLIFLLNSSMHIYSIVKEFSPILCNDGSDTPTDKLTNKLNELDQSSNQEVPQPDEVDTLPPPPVEDEPDEEEPISPTEVVTDDPSPEPSQLLNDISYEDDEVSLSSPTASSSILVSPTSQTVISSHFENYNKISDKLHSLSIKKYPCTKCNASFVFKHALKRHLDNNSCFYWKDKSSKRAVFGQLKLNKVEHESSTGESQNGLPESNITDPASKDAAKPTCEDCGKTFANLANLRRHHRLQNCLLNAKPNSSSLSVSLPSNTSHNFNCSFCASKFTSRRYLYVHKKKFRCPRRCKFCDFSGSRVISVQVHLQKEHGATMSLDEIERYNFELYKEHFKNNDNGYLSRSLDSSSKKLKKISRSNGEQVYACSVYKCTFSCKHLGGVTTHKQFHEARVAREDPSARKCDVCAFVGIPADEFDDHECIAVDDSDYRIQGKSEGSSDEVGDEGGVSNEDDSGEDDENDPVEENVNEKVLISPKSVKPRNSAGTGAKRKISNYSSTKSMYPCKVCEFVGMSPNSIAGHMNAHKPKKPRISFSKT